jgi:uncharacterized protein (DUF488 family)
MKLFTVGVYGSSEDEFYGKLIANHIDLFCDIRQRRGVRGSKYAFVNSIYLQRKLAELGIGYIYEKGLAPTRQIREMQWEEDKAEHQTKKTRETLGHAFCCGYEMLILETANLDELMATFKTEKAENIVFFCLEEKPEACHRSLLANRLAKKYHLEVTNL